MQNFRALGALPPDPRVSGGWELCPQTPQPPAAGGFAPRPSLASGGWGFAPRPPKQPPHCEFLATRLCRGTSYPSSQEHVSSRIKVLCSSIVILLERN